jgi:hypothetical protein
MVNKLPGTDAATEVTVPPPALELIEPAEIVILVPAVMLIGFPEPSNPISVLAVLLDKAKIGILLKLRADDDDPVKLPNAI